MFYYIARVFFKTIHIGLTTHKQPVHPKRLNNDTILYEATTRPGLSSHRTGIDSSRSIYGQRCASFTSLQVVTFQSYNAPLLWYDCNAMSAVHHVIKTLIEQLFSLQAISQKLRKATTSFVMSVCLSVCPSARNNSAPTERIFIKVDILVFFENLSRRVKFH